MCGHACVKYTLYFMAFVFFICGVASVAVGFVSGGDELIKAAGYRAKSQVGFLVIAVFFIITAFTTILAAKKSFCLWGLLNFIFTLVIGVTFISLGAAAVYVKQTELDDFQCNKEAHDILKGLIETFDAFKPIQPGNLCSNDCPCNPTDETQKKYISDNGGVVSADGKTRFQDCPKYNDQQVTP